MSLSGGGPTSIRQNATGFEGLAVDELGNVFVLEGNGVGGTQVTRIDASGTASVLVSSGATNEYSLISYYGGHLYLADDNDQVLRIEASVPTTTPAVVAALNLEIDHLVAGDGGFVYVIGCSGNTFVIAEVAPAGQVRTLATSTNPEYIYLAASCGRLFVVEDHDPLQALRPLDDPSRSLPQLGPIFFQDPNNDMGEIKADCTGRVFAPFDDWMAQGVPAIVRIDSAGVTTPIHVGQAGQEFEAVAINDPSEYRLWVSTRGSYDARFAFSAIPSGTVIGGFIASADTTAPLGAGSFFGISSDALTAGIIQLAPNPAPGNLFLWPWPVSGLFPDLPLDLPAGSTVLLQGLSTDLLGFAVGPNVGTQNYALTNVLRMNW